MKEQTMQTDRRPTHTSYTVTCPVCGGSPLCPHRAPGYVESLPSVNALRTSNGSSVWIDPTALSSQLIAPPQKTHEKISDEAAQRSSSSEHERVKVSPKYRRSQFLQGNDIIRTSTAPQSPMWQYDSPNYQVESSLPSLSLVVSESPTQPKPPVSVTPVPAYIDKIDTVPLPSRFASVVDGPSREKNGQLNSWTAGGAAQSPYARRIAERTRHKGASRWRQNVSLNPLDRLRWWLLCPGRIEFLLWLGGTILLMTLTCVLLLVTALSFAWITPGQQSATSSLTDTSNVATDVHQTVTAITTPGLTLMLLDKGPLLPGQSVHLRGQGFTANGHVNFTFDIEHPFLDENGEPLTVETDRQGVFTVTLLLGYPPAWVMGPHIIVAHDLATHHRAAVSLTLASGLFGKKGTATPAPGATDTPTPGDPGIFPTPVGQTPVPVTPSPGVPTPDITPTSTQAGTPSPTETVGTTPTTAPGKTPTPHTTPTAHIQPSATSTHAATGSSLSDALDNSYAKAQERLITPAVLFIGLWVFLFMLAMAMFGLAGVLRKQRQR